MRLGQELLHHFACCHGVGFATEPRHLARTEEECLRGHIGFLIPGEDGLGGGEQGDFARMVAKLSIGMGRHEYVTIPSRPEGASTRVMIFAAWTCILAAF